MMKVKMKISGGFRTFEAACDFAVVRSVVATARKRGWSIQPKDPGRRPSRPHPDPGRVTLSLGANQRLRRAIMDENGGGAGRFVGAFATGDRVRLT